MGPKPKPNPRPLVDIETDIQQRLDYGVKNDLELGRFLKEAKDSKQWKKEFDDFDLYLKRRWASIPVNRANRYIRTYTFHTTYEAKLAGTILPIEAVEALLRIPDNRIHTAIARTRKLRNPTYDEVETIVKDVLGIKEDEEDEPSESNTEEPSKQEEYFSDPEALKTNFRNAIESWEAFKETMGQAQFKQALLEVLMEE
jgi:hypothetical protein